MTNHIWSLLMTIKDYHPWLSPVTIIHDYEHYLWTSPMTIRPYDLWLITCEYHTRLLPMTITHDYEHHSWSITAPMTSLHHSWLSPLCVTYDCHRSLITRDDHYHPWPSSPKTITNDHHSWSSGLITWLLTHDFSLMAIKVFSPMTMTTIGDFPSYDHHPWAWHPPYDHDFSPMTSHPTAMTTLWPWSVLNDHQDTHPWPSEWSAMSTLGLSCG